MSGYAAVSAYGRLTGAPREIKTRTGTPMTVARLASSLPCRENGEDGEATAFFGLVAFGDLAESLARHVKGDALGAFGRVQINRYKNRDGEAREEMQITTDGLVSVEGEPAPFGPAAGARRRRRRRLPTPRTRCRSPNPPGQHDGRAAGGNPLSLA